MTPQRRRLFDGWPIVGAATIVVAALVGATFATSAPGEAAVRASIRTTATSSFAFFVVTFAASSLCALRPSPVSKWMLRNRRQLGVSFAVSQGAHLALIGVLASRFASSFWGHVALTTLVGGGLGYVFTAAMVLTSFDRTAAWLGRARWRTLHRFGMYVIFAIFAFTYLPRVADPRYAAFTALLGLTLALRVVVARRGRRPKASRQ